MEVSLKEIKDLRPIAGETGKSYSGYLGGKKVFVKKNSTPFFVAVANENLAPHLLWHKQIDGAFWSAQEWLSNHILKSSEVRTSGLKMINILKKLHQSDSLTLMLYRLEGDEMEPIDCLQEYYWQLPKELERLTVLQETFNWLENRIPDFDHFQICACHGDVIHQNWVFDANEDDLYLIDWDSAILADAFYDLGRLLYDYFPIDSWRSLLREYGLEGSKEQMHKIWWYGQIQHLMQIKSYFKKADKKSVIKELQRLNDMNERKKRYYART